MEATGCGKSTWLQCVKMDFCNAFWDFQLSLYKRLAKKYTWCSYGLQLYKALGEFIFLYIFFLCCGYQDWVVFFKIPLLYFYASIEIKGLVIVHNSTSWEQFFGISWICCGLCFNRGVCSGKWSWQQTLLPNGSPG